MPNSAFNLLANNALRPALADEPEHLGPEVPFVGVALALARRRERLTGAGAGPDASVVGPSCQAKSLCPTSDTGEEVCVSVAFKVASLQFCDRAPVDPAGRHESRRDQPLDPVRGERVVFVVEVHDYGSPRTDSATHSASGSAASTTGVRGAAVVSASLTPPSVHVRSTVPSARCDRSSGLRSAANPPQSTWRLQSRPSSQLSCSLAIAQHDRGSRS